MEASKYQDSRRGVHFSVRTFVKNQLVMANACGTLNGPSLVQSGDYGAWIDRITCSECKAIARAKNS